MLQNEGFDCEVFPEKVSEIRNGIYNLQFKSLQKNCNLNLPFPFLFKYYISFFSKKARTAFTKALVASV